MILSDTEILKEIKHKNIVIKPFNADCLGSNSYDVHLGKYLAVYSEYVLDAKKHNTVKYIKIPKQGFVLQPGVLYLGVTKEYTESHKHICFLEGKSSTGRLGVQIHSGAGAGDVGFCNNWTMHITCVQPVRIYQGMPIGQLIFFDVLGKVKVPYSQKNSAKYNSKTVKPIESKMFKNSF